MTNDPLARKIVELARARPHLSFVEVGRFCPEETGDTTILAPGHPSIWLWHGMSKTLATTIVELVSTGQLEFVPATWMVYLIDGAVPRLPIAKRLRDYKTTHWLPVTMCVPKTTRRTGTRPHAAASGQQDKKD